VIYRAAYLGFLAVVAATAASPIQVGVAEFRLSSPSIWMRGDIDLDAAEHLRTVMASAKVKIGAIHLNSEGGIVAGGLDLAEAIKDNG
jgi:hypothetical protein